jgi:hypothetical protein
MVPGIPGYVSMRERQNMKWTKADGTQNPDWWEIDGKRDTDLLEKVQNAGQVRGEDMDDYEIVSLQIAVAILADRTATTSHYPKNPCGTAS